MRVVPEVESNTVAPGADDAGSIFVFPATSAQRRYWLLDQLLPGGNPALNMPIGLRWRGPIDPRILKRALNAIVTRHEALRTTFEPDRKQLQQLIVPTLEIDFPVEDAGNSSGSQDVQSAARFMQEESRKSFDLRAGPLLRARLVHLSPNEHLLLLTVHHLVSDGWSNMILVRDLCTTYTALLKGTPSPLPDLTLQFADYADWQAARIAADDFAGQRAYWQSKLAGEIAGLQLPFDHTQRGGPTAASDSRTRLLPAELVRAAKSLGATEGASPFMVFFTAFEALLYRYTDQVDFLITSPTANRERSEFESVVGSFANPLLLRADLQGDPSFHELLGRVRKVALEAFANQDIPFEALLDEFDAAQIQVNFNYDVGAQQPCELPDDVTVESIPAVSTGTVYHLSALLQEGPDGLRVEFEYKTALFDSGTVERMLGHFQMLLQAVVADPSKPLSQLRIFTPEEEQQLKKKKSRAESNPLSSVSAEKVSTSESVQPYLGLQFQLIAIWEDVLGVRGIGIRDDFFDLGGNSLLAIRMLQRAEAACGKVILPSALFRRPTIEHLAGEIAREVMNESATLLRVNDAGTRPPFFYLHGDLSGGGFYSLKLSRALGADQPFYVMPPQDIRTLPAAPSIEEMAAEHLKALRAIRPNGPYVIGGFCIGGLVAYELAQQIKTAGEQVEMLLIIDAEPESGTLRMLRNLANSIGSLVGWDDEARVRQFGRWAIWRARLAEGIGHNIRGQSRRIYKAWRNRTSPAKSRAADEPVTSAQIERDLPSAFQWVSAGYRPKPYDGPVALLLSEDVIGTAQNPSRKWQILAPKTTVHALPGSHLECITAHVETLAREIQSCLQHVAPTSTTIIPGHNQ